ncbi:MAG: sigma-54-dependent Fis family transcriptional regulator [Planctomycetes bacterium]|nr:sigma-54-dependent Fis family transcriptional regulator [Planctomycetota bacterium]
MPHARILVVDDEQPFCNVLCGVLRQRGHLVTGVEKAEDALPALEKGAFDLVVCDLRLPGMSGLDCLRWTREHVPDTRFIMVTAYGDIESAVEAMKLGAADYLTKPFLFDDLLMRIDRLMDHVALVHDHEALQEELDARYEPRGLIGESAPMQKVRDLIRRVARTASNVLIIGESGTGKEVVARAIHRLSDRRERRMVTVNCAALPETLLESELFGHTKGAFTGASQTKEGMFEAADGGTLFLDEIGAMPAPLQSKILRAVESKEIIPIGTTVARKADARIIAATSSDLEAAAKAQRFLDALFYRLNVFQIQMPPLRERRSDIPGLVHHFVQRLGHELKKPAVKVTDNAMALLMAYGWPGNVRELENAIERALIVCDSGAVTVDDLPMSLQAQPRGPDGRPLDLRSYVRRCELEHIHAVLALAEQDKVKAAKMMGMSLSTLYRKLEDREPADSATTDAAEAAPPEPPAPPVPAPPPPTPPPPEVPPDAPERHQWRRAKPPF